MGIKVLIAVLFLLLSVFLLIFATQFDITTEKVLRNSGVTLTDDPKKVFWFLQISDIHLSKFKDKSRISDFRRFCDEVADAIKPKVIIASGDLTDAKDEILGSMQYHEEWEAYFKTIVETGVVNRTTWLDIRGNHDNFNVQHLHDSTDLFQYYSAQGRKNKKSYLHKEELDGDTYNFLALDASIEPGTKRPYNFIGMIPKDELNRVEKLLLENPSNHTVWFAHYPTSTILTPAGSIRKFIGKFNESSVFVAGHLHTLGGLVFRMHALQSEGFLELELGDFMKNRLYRIGVFDNGLFSFADVKLGKWPLAVITNPKNILHNNPFKENIALQSGSSHIRILAFSTSKITHCKIRLNGVSDWIKCEQKTENFFTVPWDPAIFSRGKHKIEVLIGDAEGRIFNQEQYFSLDGSRVHFDFLAKFILMSDVTTLFQLGFLMAFVGCLAPLIFFKAWQLLIKAGKLRRPKVPSQFSNKYLMFASTDRIYYVLLFWLIYTAVGPWSFHEILDGHIGVLTVWGTFVKGTYMPGTLNWWYGFHQLLFFQFPLMIIIVNVLHRRYKRMLKKNSVTYVEDTWIQALYDNLSFVALVTAELLLLIFYFIQNGFLSTLIAPIRFWGLLLSIYLFHLAHWRISDYEFQQSTLVCSPDSKLATS